MVAENYQGVFGDIGGGGGALGINQAEVTVSGGEGGTVFQEFPVPFEGLEQGFVPGFAPLLPVDEGGNILTKPGEAARVKAGLCFGHGEKDGFFRIFGPALGQGVEKAHRIQFVAKKLHAERQVMRRGKNI